MKKIYQLTAIICIACATSCSDNTTSTTEGNSTNPTTATDNNTKPAAPSDQPEGLALMNSSDCGACHNATAKVVGPSYKDIAAKYPNTPENVAKLTDEIIKGSSGIWGSVPMTPHSTAQRSDVEKMVGYILTMK